jgi:DNA adenine methylase
MSKTPVPIRPFLKWAGNKFRIIDRVRAALPEGRRLVEPFVGSGAVFLNTDYSRYLLADSNADLIAVYQCLQQEGVTFLSECRDLFAPEHNRSRAYYRLRAEFNASRDPWRRALLFVYLNRHGYNGLCRYNASGGFNVPFGSYKRPYFPEKEMHLFHDKAQGVEFRHADYTTVMTKPRRGDVYYCDPPYVPLSTSANFTTYSAGGFAVKEQYRLAEAARRLAARGYPVLISNHNTEFTRDVYTDAHISEFQVQRYISCNGTGRNKAGELLALFTPDAAA